MAYLGRKGATAPLTTADIPDGIIVASDLAPNSVDSSELVDGSVDLSHMSANSVDSDQYVDGSIDNAHLADDAVGTDELANDVVINTSGAITTTGAFTSVGIDDNASGAVAITIDSNENVGIGLAPSAERFAVKCADSTNSNFRVLGAASGSSPEGAVCMGPQDLDASASGSICALHFNTGNETGPYQIEFSLNIGDNWRKGHNGVFWIVMSHGTGVGAGYLTITKGSSTSTAIVCDWTQVINAGANSTITKTTTTNDATQAIGYLRLASTDMDIRAYTINKVSGSAGNGGDVPTFTFTTF